MGQERLRLQINRFIPVITHSANLSDPRMMRKTGTSHSPPLVPKFPFGNDRLCAISLLHLPLADRLPKTHLDAQNAPVKVKSLEDIFRALQDAKARYLVVGGLAVIAHGYVRLTKDLDLVLDFSPDSLPRALEALESLGYHPMIPVSIRDFANPELRRDWAENQNMTVISDRYPDVTIDILCQEPFIFEAEYAAAEWKHIAPYIQVHFVKVETLIALKAKAYAELDLVDIGMLQKLQINEPSEPWPCDWDSHELAQLRRDASRTFRQNLEWLEETTEFAHRFAAAPWLPAPGAATPKTK